MHRSLEPLPMAMSPRCHGQNAMDLTATLMCHRCIAAISPRPISILQRFPTDYIDRPTGPTRTSSVDVELSLLVVERTSLLLSSRMQVLSLPPLAKKAPSGDHTKPQ